MFYCRVYITNKDFLVDKEIIVTDCYTNVLI